MAFAILPLPAVATMFVTVMPVTPLVHLTATALKENIVIIPELVWINFLRAKLVTAASFIAAEI